MSGRGYASHGCSVCRKRKIKCDEGQPGCLRCLKIGVTCPGYPFGDSLVFRNATKELVRGGNINNSDSDREQTITILADANSYSPIPLLLVPSSSPCADFEAECCFIHQFSTSYPRGNLTSFMSTLSRHLSIAKDGSCLQLAAQATSYANADSISHIQIDPKLARKHYGNALVALKRSILDPGEAGHDSTLAAIILLMLYENITGESFQSFGQHLQGLNALLRLRHSGTNDDTPIDYNISQDAARWLLLMLLRLQQHAPPELGRLFISHPTHSKLLLCILEINNLRAETAQILQTFSFSDSSNEILLLSLEKCVQADLRLRNCTNHQSNERIDLTESPQDVLPTDTSTLILALGARVLLIQTILQICRKYRDQSFDTTKLHVHVESLSNTHLGKISQLINQVLSFIHSMLDRAQMKAQNLAYIPQGNSGMSAFALQLLWPLGVVCACPFATEAQFELSSRLVTLIGQTYGLRRALILRDVWIEQRSSLR